MGMISFPLFLFTLSLFLLIDTQYFWSEFVTFTQCIETVSIPMTMWDSAFSWAVSGEGEACHPAPTTLELPV